MKVFMTAATGFQGSKIANELVARGHAVTSIKRNLSSDFQAMDGLQLFEGGLDSTEALSSAMRGAQAAVYTFPLIFDLDLAKKYTQNFIDVARLEGVELVVFNTTFYLASEETGLLALDMKVAMKELFDASGLNVITIAPNIYLDNIAAPWSVPVILEHKIVPYPLKADKAMSWISHEDLGKYIASALDKPELAGQTFPVGSLIKGNDITESIGSKIGQKLTFVEVPVDEFEQQLVPGFGDIAAREISNLYRYVEQNYNSFIEQDYKRTNEALGIEPQSLDSWVSSVNWSVS